MEITLDQPNSRFVLKTGNSVSCLGFDVVFQQALELMRRVAAYVRKHGSLRDADLMTLFERLAPIREDAVGTRAQYEQYATLLGMYRQVQDPETWFDARTPKAVQDVLESYRSTGRPLRLFLGDPKTGRDWLEESDCVGKIERSLGPMRAPIILERHKNCGPAILTDCVVRILDASTGAELYRHPTYSQPMMRLVAAPSYDAAEGYKQVVEVQDDASGHWDVHARFTTPGKAASWLAFMRGETCRYRA